MKSLGSQEKGPPLRNLANSVVLKLEFIFGTELLITLIFIALRFYQLYELLRNVAAFVTITVDCLGIWYLERTGCQPRPVSPSSSLISSGLKDYIVEGIVRIPVAPLADTGAQSNFVSEEFVDSIGLKPDRRSPRKIQLLDGKQVPSIGVVDVQFSFSGESEVHTLKCEVLSRCPSNLVLSGEFLRATGTLSRIKAMPRPEKIRLLSGFLNRKHALALPDTGSDITLVSAKWAEDNELEIDNSPEHRLGLRLADSTRAETKGMVLRPEWTFGDSNESATSFPFYVLQGLPVDIILSGDFTMYHQALFKDKKIMREINSPHGISGFYNVKLIQGKRRIQKSATNDSFSSIAKPPGVMESELARRDRNLDDKDGNDDSSKHFDAGKSRAKVESWCKWVRNKR